MLVSFSCNLGHILNKERNSKWGCGMKKRVFFFNAIILTASSLVMRASSIGYRTYLSSKIGNYGIHFRNQLSRYAYCNRYHRKRSAVSGKTGSSQVYYLRAFTKSACYGSLIFFI